jgi:hypothetical protein
MSWTDELDEAEPEPIAHDGRRFKVISPDSIGKVLECCRKFFYKKVEPVHVEPERAAIDGRNLHTGFQHFFKFVNPAELLKPYSHYQFTEYFYGQLTQNIPLTFATIPKYKLVLHNFAEIESKLLLNCKAYFQNDRDSVLHHWYPHSIEQDIKSEELELNGRHDRIDNLFGESPSFGCLDGEKVVIDFKTGDAPSPRKLKDGTLKREIPSRVRRTFVYYKQLSATKGDEINYMCLVYPKDFVRIFEPIKKISITKANQAKEKALKYANAGDTIDCFPVNITYKCFRSAFYFGCDYLDVCQKTWTKADLQRAQDIKDGKLPKPEEE